MYCNKPYINTGTAFNNGQCFGYNTFNPSPTSGIYPDSIVGEGIVNHITLPDGTCQYFFTPANWWPPNPHCNVNPNQNNPYWNSNIGTWFVRSISIPTQPPFRSNSPFQRHEAPRPLHCSEYKMNVVPNGYQLKFHDDRWTSTTDLHFFCPRMRQIEHTFAFPSTGCAAVQVNTPLTTNTVCSYEVVNSKTCHCAASRHFVDTPVSAMSLDIESKTTAEDSKPSNSFKSKRKKDSSDKSNSRQLQLLPRDVRKKRVQFEKKTKNVIKNKSKSICECHQPLLIKSNSKEMNIDSYTSPLINKSTNTHKNHSIEVSCECWPSVSVAEGTTTADNVECKSSQIHKHESKSKTMYECGSPLIINSKSRDVIGHSCPSPTAKNHYSKDVSCECWPSLPEDTAAHVEKATDCHINKKVSQSKDSCECDTPLGKSLDINSDACPPLSVKESTATYKNQNVENVICECWPPVPESMPGLIKSKTSNNEINKNSQMELDSLVEECLKQIELWYPNADDSKNYFQCCKKPSEACCSRQFKGK